jgi:hypothetical protein
VKRLKYNDLVNDGAEDYIGILEIIDRSITPIGHFSCNLHVVPLLICFEKEKNPSVTHRSVADNLFFFSSPSLAASKDK